MSFKITIGYAPIESDKGPFLLSQNRQFQYFLREIISIRKRNDIKFYFMSTKRLLEHLLDFDRNQNKVGMLFPKFWLTW